MNYLRWACARADRSPSCEAMRDIALRHFYAKLIAELSRAAAGFNETFYQRGRPFGVNTFVSLA